MIRIIFTICTLFFSNLVLANSSITLLDSKRTFTLSFGEEVANDWIQSYKNEIIESAKKLEEESELCGHFHEGIIDLEFSSYDISVYNNHIHISNSSLNHFLMKTLLIPGLDFLF